MCRPSLTSLVSVVWRSNASLKLNSTPRQQGFECRYQRRSVEGCTYGVASGFIIYLTEALLFRFWSLLVTKHLLPYWHSGILLGAKGYWLCDVRESGEIVRRIDVEAKNVGFLQFSLLFCLIQPFFV